MRHKDCIFVEEEECPKDNIGLTCAECEQHKHYEMIEKALRDFTGMGESFENIFALFKKIADHDGGTVEIQTPAESIMIINRVFVSLLGTTPITGEREIMYRRMIFRCFGIFVDEFESKEYKEKDYVH